MNTSTSAEQQIDDATVQRYFNGDGGTTAAALCMMAHEHNLPAGAAHYRLSREILTIRDWLDSVGASGRVLDVGCGAGAWAEIFAGRYSAVTGIERSSMMVEAARKRVADLPNVEIFEGDGRDDLPEGPFEMIFLGGMCMYLGDADVVALLRSLRHHLSGGGSIILRESTVRQGISMARGEYQAVYRSVNMYHQLFEDAGPFSVEVRRNYGYTNMVTAEALVDMRRRWLPFLPKDSPALGSLTWWALRGATPLSFWALPRLFSLLDIPWPRLQNHFFRLRPGE
ncbi:MAG: class I SAM-dependent methyltransferase [Dehalococcoidia bacterium]